MRPFFRMLFTIDLDVFLTFLRTGDTNACRLIHAQQFPSVVHLSERLSSTLPESECFHLWQPVQKSLWKCCGPGPFFEVWVWVPPSPIVKRSGGASTWFKPRAHLLSFPDHRTRQALICLFDAPFSPLIHHP